MGIAIGNPPRSKRRWYTYLLILLLLAFAGGYLWVGNGEIISRVSSLAGEIEQTAEDLKETVFNQLHIEESEAENQNSDLSKTVAFQNAQEPSEKLEQPQPAPEPEQKIEADISTPEVTIPETPVASEEAVAEVATVESPTLSQSAESETVTDQTVDQNLASESSPEQNDSTASAPPESSETQVEEAAKTEVVPDTPAPEAETDLAATAEQPAAKEDNPLLHVGILVYYLKNEGSDKKIQQKLQEAGYTDVVAKGKWPGAFNDQNVFFRSEDQPGVKEVMDVLGDNWFDYYYNGPRISRSVKKLFSEEDHIQFLIIPR